VLQQTSEVIVRDEQSWFELDKLPIKNDQVSQTYESVIGLNDLFSAYILPSKRKAILGISIYATQARPKHLHSQYITTIAALADYAIEQGYEIRFLPMELKDGTSDDRPLIYEIIKKIKHDKRCMVEEYDMDTPTHLSEVAKYRMFVGHKTHSIIFALTVGTPLIAIAYHKKTEDFMNQYELDRYCIPDTILEKDQLIDKFKKLSTEIDSIGIQAFEKSLEYGEIVRDDFGRMINNYR
jgi:polysaccharide pyruvyl transferase WcaK-like protein